MSDENERWSDVSSKTLLSRAGTMSSEVKREILKTSPTSTTLSMFLMKSENSAEIKSMLLNGLEESQNQHGTSDKFSTLRGFKLMSSKRQITFSFFRLVVTSIFWWFLEWSKKALILASVRSWVSREKVSGRGTEVLLLFFSKAVFLAVNQLFSEGIIHSEKGNHFSKCGDFNKHLEGLNQASGLRVCDWPTCGWSTSSRTSLFPW